LTHQIGEPTLEQRWVVFQCSQRLEEAGGVRFFILEWLDQSVFKREHTTCIISAQRIDVLL
jgi:hypothetical protein